MIKKYSYSFYYSINRKYNFNNFIFIFN